MCGIFGLCQYVIQNGVPHELPCKKWIPLMDAYTCSGYMSHRGPDMRNYYQHPTNGSVLFHERLAINDLECFQPIEGSAPTRQVVHNGEIYNCAQLKEHHLKEYKSKTTCDSEVLIQLYDKFRGKEFCNLLDGIFAIALIYDEQFFAARDPIGVKPLYYGFDSQGRFYCASEMKAIQKFCAHNKMNVFPPGFYYTPESGFVRYYEPMWLQPTLQFKDANLRLLRETLIQGTIKRLMSDAPLGMLLSGGLDSSLICAIATRALKKMGKPLKTYAVGLHPDTPDLKAARKVARFLGTDHTEVYFTVQEGISLLNKLIYHLESYDITTVRAATPMYFLSRKIKSDGIKVVLSGEGSDEIFGGYLYFHNAPTHQEFHEETVRRVKLLSTADLLRADKSCMANGVEVRVPFLDKEFLEVAMSLDPSIRTPTKDRIEKHVIRQAFDNKEDPFIPDEVLWRQKEQFSDGVGYSWIDSLREHAEQVISNQEFELATQLFPINTPRTKEALLIRRIFESHFPSTNAASTVHPWVPKWQTSQDPSGRACSAHKQGHHTSANMTQKQTVMTNGHAMSNGHTTVNGNPMMNGHSMANRCGLTNGHAMVNGTVMMNGTMEH